jgi:hypothetical protein
MFTKPGTDQRRSKLHSAMVSILAFAFSLFTLGCGQEYSGPQFSDSLLS